MLSAFRRLVRSKVGAVVAVLLLGVLALLMVSGDVSSLQMGGGSALSGGDVVATVGGTDVHEPEVRSRVTQAMEAYRQQQPTLDMQQFVAQGGYDGVLQQLVNSLALAAFGRDQGIVTSKRAVDGQIASLPGLAGPTGQFDPDLFRRLLAERKLTERAVRDDIARDLMGRLLTERLLRPLPAPRQLALPLASLSLEKREGEIAFVPSSAMPAGPAPTDAELQAFYARNVARYTVPERRVIRFARVTPDLVKARATPTDAEIAAAYRADAAKYAATEQRSITQVVILDQAGAQALGARVKGGQPLAAAARAAGLEPSTLAGLDKAAMAQRTSPALANAVFGAAQGAVVGPVRGGIGFTVATVDAVRQVAGRTLAQAREEIVAALTKQKTADALNAVQTALDDKLADSANFAELVADQKLSAETTGPLLASGIDPDRPGPADPTLAPLVQAAFQMGEGDEPLLVPTGQDGSFALVALDRVIAAAPRPLAQVRDEVAKAVQADRTRQAARKVAGQILAAVNRGQSFAQAWSATGLKAAAPRPLAASREDVDRAQGPTRGPLALLFSIPRGAARLLEEPNAQGWAVIKLNTVIPGDASRDPARVAGRQRAFGQVLGRESFEQFVRAARADVGVEIDAAEAAKVKADLAGGATR